MRVIVNHKDEDVSIYGTDEEIDNLDDSLDEEIRSEINIYRSLGYSLTKFRNGSDPDLAEAIKQLILNHV